MNSDEEFSIHVSEALDLLGYNKDLVTARRKAYDYMSNVGIWKEMQRKHNIDSESYATISGSKREGLAAFNESDIDVMLTFSRIQCSDDPASATSDKYVFEIDREGCPQGYTKLRLYKRNGIKNPEIENSLLEYPDGSWYLSSTLYMSEVDPKYSPYRQSDELNHIYVLPRAGPSHPRVNQPPFAPFEMNLDSVAAFPCQCREYLQAWIDRPRDYDWPSRDQIETIATLDAHVVPVGAKGSEDAHLQWRICYTLPEINLMQSLNETKWKLYAILKMIKDLEFKPLGDLITSYVLKNVIMWISEFEPIEAFQPKYILDKLRQCLDFIILGFLGKRIPNYMISNRNLLEGRLTDHNHKEYLAALNKIRKNLPATILRCSKLKHAMNQVYAVSSTARAAMVQCNRDEMHSLSFLPYSHDALMQMNLLRQNLTPQDWFNLVLKTISDHPEIVANNLNVSVAEVTFMCQIYKLLPPETVERKVQMTANRWVKGRQAQ